MGLCRNIRKMSRGHCRTVYRPRPALENSLAHSLFAWSWPQNQNRSRPPVVTLHTRPPVRPLRNATALLGLLSAISFPQFVAAAEWSWQPSILLSTGVDDNANLTTGPHDTVSAVILNPRILLSKKTEVSDVNLAMSLKATRYSGDQVEDRDSQILSLASSLQTTERSKWSFDGLFRRDTLIETIDTTPDTGDLQDIDVGLVEKKVRRNRARAQPSWSYALSERSSLALRYGFTDVSFSDAEGTGLVDYRNQQLGATYSRRISDKNDLNLAVNGFAYRPDDENNTKSDTTQLLAGISHAYSETSRGYFLIGPAKTEQTSPTGTQDSTNLVLEAGMGQRSELTTFDGVISRNVQSSGFGRAVLSNQLRMYLVRKISPMLNVVLRAKVIRNKALEGSNPNDDRRYYELAPALRWQWRPNWVFGAEYRYREKKFDTAPEAAESNAAFISVSYSLPLKITSR